MVSGYNTIPKNELHVQKMSVMSWKKSQCNLFITFKAMSVAVMCNLMCVVHNILLIVITNIGL